MIISSRATYILPFLLLAAASLSMGMSILGYSPGSLAYVFDIGIGAFLPLIAMTAGLAAGFYFLFRMLAGKIKMRTVQAVAILLPAVVQTTYSFVRHRGFDIGFAYAVEGLLLLWAVNLLSYRYVARLTESSIELVSLLGQRLSIPLSSLTSLEQKKNLLSLIQALGFLNISRKTGVSYRDEAQDEFEVNIYTRAFKSTGIFAAIVDRAAGYGNHNIRQYRF